MGRDSRVEGKRVAKWEGGREKELEGENNGGSCTGRAMI